MGIGVIIPLIIGAISVSMAWADGSYDLVYGLENVGGEVDEGTTYIERFGDFPWWIYVVAVPIGLFLGFSQVIPGLSATAFLMLIGFFRPLVESVSVTYWSTYPQIFAFYVIMGISLIAGFILTSKLMTVLFKWNRISSTASSSACRSVRSWPCSSIRRTRDLCQLGDVGWTVDIDDRRYRPLSSRLWSAATSRPIFW